MESTLKFIAHRVLVNEKICQDTFEDLVRISKLFDIVLTKSLEQNSKTLDLIHGKTAEERPLKESDGNKEKKPL